MPTPRTPDASEAPPLRWGVIGPGWIAERFIGSIRRHTRQQVLAVASRDLVRSTAFASKHGIERPIRQYQNLLADPDVDVVYIATPHNAHYPCAQMSLQAGKHTLVEKPIALNATPAAELTRLAAERMSSSWGPCGQCSCGNSTSFGNCSTTVCSVRSAPSSQITGELFTDDHRIMRQGVGVWVSPRGDLHR